MVCFLTQWKQLCAIPNISSVWSVQWGREKDIMDMLLTSWFQDCQVHSDDSSRLFYIQKYKYHTLNTETSHCCLWIGQGSESAAATDKFLQDESAEEFQRTQ